MGIIVTGKAAGFPQTGSNRTRAEIVKDILDYVGGESDNTMKDRAARALNAAIRKFNQVAWSFNRQIEDIQLDPTLGMLPNVSNPTVSRDAGVGTGFVLATGKVIRYWVEERVKSGSSVLKRNDGPATVIGTLTGDGSTDKPVITRPSVVNPDATHWALFATSTDGIYPDGGQIAEVPIATTTIEDTRTGNNPLLPTGGIFQGGEYDLNSDFRNPLYAHLIDEEGRERGSIHYVPWRQFTPNLVRQTTGTMPLMYTVRNAWRTGKVSFLPRIGTGPLTYPFARIAYNSRIAQLTGDANVLQVPEEVEQAILEAALVPMIAKYRSFDEARIARSDAQDSFNLLAAEYQDFEDF